MAKKEVIEKKLIKLPESATKLVGRYQFVGGNEQRDVQIEVIRGIETLSWAKVGGQFANRVFIPVTDFDLERLLTAKTIRKI